MGQWGVGGTICGVFVGHWGAGGYFCGVFVGHWGAGSPNTRRPYLTQKKRVTSGDIFLLTAGSLSP